tara:strand:+ start:168 stop:662 length:495 start_codon:yes stop_codon:yes gene_type:complete
MSQLKVNSIVPVGGLTSGANGGIIQIVHAETTSQVSDTGGSFVDSGVTAAITPSSNSSKILVVASMQYFIRRDATETSGSFKLLRGSTAISTHTGAVHIEADTTSQSRIIAEGGYTIQRLDSPATTSATTYKVQFTTNHTGNSAEMRVSNDSAPSCITLYEVTV